MDTSFMNNIHNSSDIDYAFKEYEVDSSGNTIISGYWQEHDDVLKLSKTFKDVSEDINITESYVKSMMSDSTIGDPEDMLNNRFNKFSRWGYMDPAGELITGAREYIFFSKPDLHLVDPSSPDTMNSQLASPFFQEAFKRYKLSYYSLQQYYAGKSSLSNVEGMTINLKNKYINLLSNMVTSSFDLPDITSGEVTNNTNLYQIGTSYREGSITSDLQYDFSLEFKDTKYFDVYMLFKIYDEYFRAKYMMDITPTRYDYIYNKIYPEALSIWKIITDDSGRIMYWAKATGCTPVNVPRSAISGIENNIKITVNWKAQFVKDMDPVNLSELNYLTVQSLGSTEVGTSGGEHPIMTFNNKDTWAAYPFVLLGDRTEQPIHRTGSAHQRTDRTGFHRLVWVKN